MAGLLFSGCGKKGALSLRAFEPPPSPAGLIAIHRGDSILLVWGFPADRDYSLSGFMVTKESATGLRQDFSVPAGERTYIDREIAVGETYRYQVRAANDRGGLSSGPPPVPASPQQPPPPPQGVRIAVRGDSVVLTWDGIPGGAYNVYRRHDGQPFGITPQNSTPLRLPIFSDGLDLRRRVHYAVRGLLATGIRDEGELSTEVAMDPRDLVPPAPRNARWHATADRIVITWDEAEESWVPCYRIYRRIGGEGYVPVGETQIPSFMDADPAPGARDYRITACGPAREGPPAELSGIGLPLRQGSD